MHKEKLVELKASRKSLDKLVKEVTASLAKVPSFMPA